MRKPRPFTLVDAMALVLAAALGTAEVRHRLADPRLSAKYWSLVSMGFFKQWVWIVDFFGRAIVYPYLTMLTIVIIVLRYRQPRPPSRRLHRQPGMVAVVAAAVGMIAALVVRAGPTLNHFYHRDFTQLAFDETLKILWGWCGRLAGLSVLASWITLVLSGCWRPERSWIDRLGRLVGVLWISSLAVWAAYTLAGFEYL
jgi:amino acid transporter